MRQFAVAPTSRAWRHAGGPSGCVHARLANRHDFWRARTGGLQAAPDIRVREVRQLQTHKDAWAGFRCERMGNGSLLVCICHSAIDYLAARSILNR